MQSFTVSNPTTMIFGSDKLDEFISLLKTFGTRVLLVTGGGSLTKNGFYDPVTLELKKHDCQVFEFKGVEPNPLNKTIDLAAREHFNNNIDIVVGFGGGSVMDAAKAISALLYLEKFKADQSLPREVWPYVLGGPLVGRLPGALPLAMIPTTAATASEVTPYAVISNKEEIGKAPLAYEFFKPCASWLNPEFTTRLSSVVTADGGADILSHVFENYLLGGNDSPLTDRYCEAIINTVVENLPVVLKNPYDLAARGNLMWSSTLALNGFHTAGRTSSMFVLHAIEHSMSAIKHELAHGRGLATLFPAYFRWLWNKDRARERLTRLGQFIFGIGGAAIEARSGNSGLYFIDKFEMWLKECGLLQSAYSLGFKDDDFETIASYVIKTYGGGKPLNVLGEMTELDIIDVLKLTCDQG